jgi:acyl carrier protein
VVVIPYCFDEIDTRLIAYVLPVDMTQYHDKEAGKKLTQTIKQFLLDHLPPHMIPANFIVIQEMPLTNSGKIDRKKLPSPKADMGSLLTENKVLTETEKQLHYIWCDILKVNSVGLHDNFFDLGGHSLLIPHLINAINEKFHKQLQPTSLFRYTTISEISKFLEDDRLVDESLNKKAKDRAEKRRSAVKRRN